MSRIKPFLIGSLSVLLAAPGARAASILGDTFHVEGTVFGDTNVIDLNSGIAGNHDFFSPNSFDINASILGDTNNLVHVRWVDQDSFEVRLETLLSPFSTDAVITLADLNFLDNGQPVDIIGAAFNPTANDYLGFFASPDNPTGAPPVADPTVSFTGTSVTIRFGGDWSDQLLADGPDLRFDVTNAAVSAPEPGTLALALTGICLMARVRRVRSSRRRHGLSTMSPRES